MINVSVCLQIIQLIACTGQPTLASNITQAQALCIATKCSQIPVFNDYHTNRRQWLSASYHPFASKKQKWAIAANNFLERSAAAIGWDIDQKTAKHPMIFGRRKKRSLQFRIPLIGKQSIYGQQKQYYASGLIKPNGTITAQLNNLTNGTTSGNLAFTLNRPTRAKASAYIWANPLTRVLTRNSNKNIQWQFGRIPSSALAGTGGGTTGSVASSSATPANKPAPAPAPGPTPKPAPAVPPAAPAAAPKPSAGGK